MARRPSVSCVIIFLNVEKYLDEAIRSVFAQTFEDWELLLVDDGSTDASPSIARRFAREHPHRVRYLTHRGHRNRGMSASRNLGVSKARGEYVALLDADDIWLPEKLSTQVEVLKSRPEAAMVYDATKLWYSWTGEPDAADRERLRLLGVPCDRLVQPPEMIPRFLGNGAETPGTCSVLIRKEAIRRIGGFVNAFRGMFEDQAFFYKMCLEYPVYISGGATALYRQHSESHCHVSEQEGLYHPNQENPALEVFLDWLAGYLHERLASPYSPARFLPDDLKQYFANRWAARRGGWRWLKPKVKEFLKRTLCLVRIDRSPSDQAESQA